MAQVRANMGNQTVDLVMETGIASGSAGLNRFAVFRGCFVETMVQWKKEVKLGRIPKIQKKWLPPKKASKYLKMDFSGTLTLFLHHHIIIFMTWEASRIGQTSLFFQEGGDLAIISHSRWRVQHQQQVLPNKHTTHRGMRFDANCSDVKCLHAQVADELSRGGNAIGRQVGWREIWKVLGKAFGGDHFSL